MNSKSLAAAIAVVLLAGATLTLGSASGAQAAAATAAPTADFADNDFASSDDGFDGGDRDGGRADGRDERGGGHGRGFGMGGDRGRGRGRGMMAHRMMALRAAKDPQLAVLHDVRAIEMAYRHDGREKDIPGLYADVLKRTSDPVVRDFLNHRLAQIAYRNGDKKGALEYLNHSLDDDLKRLK